MRSRLRLFLPCSLLWGSALCSGSALATIHIAKMKRRSAVPCLRGRATICWMGARSRPPASRGSPSCSTSGPAGAPTAAPSIRCSASSRQQCPSMVSTTGTREMRPAPGLSRRATPIALCWPTLTANWPLSSASTARRKPICLMPMVPCSPAIPASLPKGSGNASLPPCSTRRELMRK